MHKRLQNIYKKACVGKFDPLCCSRAFEISAVPVLNDEYYGAYSKIDLLYN